ncbi:MAG: phosphatidate cytidylyltransferase [Solirubrobacteraceae bacterium]|nr:phosphatidate cytidylyltransferase [Solirubrobacteraceae bacterium]MEA2301478.1 phosphatidate cytidylyltransferase [Solirubrobacteraceae bacterium]MEA2355315.1 phosphatidate cytidylyltransferase [Solirubrobacteraceae bacterium]
MSTRRPPPNPPRRPPGSRRREPRRQRSELTGRIIVAAPALVVALVIVGRGGLVFGLALLVLGWICLDELYRILGRAHPIRLAGFLGLIGLLGAAEYGSQLQILLVMVGLVPVAFGLAIISPRGGTAGIATMMLGVWWIGLALAHAILLRKLPHGDGVVIDVLVGTFVGDTAAYLGGRMFGRRPLARRISPNKTVEGLAIGIAAGIAGVVFAGLYQDWLDTGSALLLGVAVAVAAPIGDLFESFVKREAGTKDTGTLFGPHGGALDRLDAVLFAAVAGYYVWHAML